MKPVNFIEANSNNDAGDLPCYAHDTGIVACCKMNLRDRLRAILIGRMWVSIIGQYVPPMLLTTDKPLQRYRVVIDPSAQKAAAGGIGEIPAEGMNHE